MTMDATNGTFIAGCPELGLSFQSAQYLVAEELLMVELARRAAVALSAKASDKATATESLVSIPLSDALITYRQ